MGLPLHNLRGPTNVVSHVYAKSYIDRRRKDKTYRRAGPYNLSLDAAGSIVIQHHQSSTPFAKLHQNDTFEFLREPNSLKESVSVYYFTGRSCYSHKQKNVLNRFYMWNVNGNGKGGRTPVVAGMQIKDFKCLNPEICVVKRLTVKPEVRKAWRGLYDGIAPAVSALIRLTDDLRTIRAEPPTFVRAEDELARLEAGEPDVSQIAYLGAGKTQGWWRYRREREKWHDAMARRVIKNARAALRDEYYRKYDAYQVAP